MSKIAEDETEDMVSKSGYAGVYESMCVCVWMCVCMSVCVSVCVYECVCVCRLGLETGSSTRICGSVWKNTFVIYLS